MLQFIISAFFKGIPMWLKSQHFFFAFSLLRGSYFLILCTNGGKPDMGLCNCLGGKFQREGWQEQGLMTCVLPVLTYSMLMVNLFKTIEAIETEKI